MFSLFKKIALISLISFGVTQFAYAADNQIDAQLAVQKITYSHESSEHKTACKTKKPPAKKCDVKQQHHKHTVKKSHKPDSKSTQQICLPPDCGT